MFTGIIKAKGTIRSLKKVGGDVRLSVESPGINWSEFDVGESISVNGVCLTATALRPTGFDADVSIETLDVTALSQLKTGSAVNLEPSVSLGERLGGHLVSGHVDCVGTVSARDNDARSVRLKIEVPAEIGRYLAKKGSVCVDGVSLTINEVSASAFDVNIIPHTAEATIIGEYAVGTSVNIEVDLIARYIERLLTGDAVSEPGSGISSDFLKAHGYA
jgi:riboflavin synthase